MRIKAKVEDMMLVVRVDREINSERILEVKLLYRQILSNSNKINVTLAFVDINKTQHRSTPVRQA